MRKLIATIIFSLFLFLPTIANAESFFVWDAPTQNEDGSPLTDLGGYMIFCGNESGNYTIAKDAGYIPDVDGVCEYPIAEVIPQDGSWYCAGKVYDLMGNESTLSNEIFFVVGGGAIDAISPQPMGNFRFRK